MYRYIYLKHNTSLTFMNKSLFSMYIDINECADGTDNCHSDASCLDTKGSFTCACKPGFRGNGLTCAGKAASLYPVRIIF